MQTLLLRSFSGSARWNELGASALTQQDIRKERGEGEKIPMTPQRAWAIRGYYYNRLFANILSASVGFEGRRRRKTVLATKSRRLEGKGGERGSLPKADGTEEDAP